MIRMTGQSDDAHAQTNPQPIFCETYLNILKIYSKRASEDGEDSEDLQNRLFHFMVIYGAFEKVGRF